MIKPIDEFSPPPADFSAGTIVLHQRYGYRGLVAAADYGCRADDAWYYANQTQPPRDQWWYHVLVDRAQHTTYVAATNLMVSPDESAIVHPLLHIYFDDFYDGRYVRNDVPWGMIG